jgi:hypothetical protein
MQVSLTLTAMIQSFYLFVYISASTKQTLITPFHTILKAPHMQVCNTNTSQPQTHQPRAQQVGNWQRQAGMKGVPHGAAANRRELSC